jgi:hypothetical protein
MKPPKIKHRKNHTRGDGFIMIGDPIPIIGPKTEAKLQAYIDWVGSENDRMIAEREAASPKLHLSA